MDSDKYKIFMCFSRKFPRPVAGPPEDVRVAFKEFAAGEGMTSEGLRRFLEEKQGEGAAGAQAEAVRIANEVRRVRQRPSYLAKLSRPPPLSLDDFHYFLFSDDLNPLQRSQVHQDMTAPLSHYFIYTGHNSYLTGNQLSSNCSDIPIIKALQRGVRVIELDLWPNSTKDNVDVLHGGTMTHPVDLIKCLKSIKEYAFCASPYPVVITLEDHLTPDLQAKVAEMATETFGDMLYHPESECFKELPSPEALKMKIIISTKPPKEYLESKNFKDMENGSRRGKDSTEEEAEEKVACGKDESDSDEKKEPEENDDDQEERESDEDDNKFRQISAPQYRFLIAIPAGKPKGSLKDALKVDPDKVRRVSLSEPKLAKAAPSHGTDLVRFTQKNILRIYPRGSRVDSSNYNPMLAWTHGAQMVAFNMQGYGKSLWLMQGLFRANGGCGYVKKPDFLLESRPDGDVFDPKAHLPVKKTLKVKVYMGDGWRLDFKQTHFDTYSPPDFYTRVGIAGVPADTVMKETRPIEDNWTPVWDEEFSFQLTVPELALLRIEVLDYDLSDKDDFAGQNCLLVSELRPGIRAVHLYDRKGMKYKNVRLLMCFEFV